ncbi:hypothetical protein F5877DRAFT_6107, partial [Lentinula edodes]
NKETRNPSGVEITRVEFHRNTPLHRPTDRTDEFKPKEIPPHIYAEAPLNIWNDSTSNIRPLPRAQQQVIEIDERLQQCNERIRSMNEQLQQV